MDPALRDALQMILGQLCYIRQLLQTCCLQSSCTPVPFPNSQPVASTVTLGVTPKAILGNNPNRIAFTVSNINGTVPVFLATDAKSAANNQPIAQVPSGATGNFTPHSFPSTLSGQWFAWVASTTPVIPMLEENYVPTG